MSRFTIVSTVALAALSSFAFAARAADEPSPFDGSWEVTLTCPPHHEDDDAKGYRQQFRAEVTDGLLDGTHGKEGEPSWHHLFGRIAPDGKAHLTLDGIVSNPAYAINNAQRGKPYSYRVRATFDGPTGTGQRLGKRKCSFDFRRR
ncbi:MAG: hypothetical protein ABI641_00945 [Caldimonas sp.]